MLDIVVAAERAIRLIGHRTEDQFASDEQNQWAVFSQIIIIGEAANRVPKEAQEAMPEIPWKLVIGMRHRLVHGYDSIDWTRVWQTTIHDLPSLKEQIESRLTLD